MPDDVRDSRRVLVGSGFVFASRMTGFAMMLVFSVFMARALGRDVYGLISITIGIFGIMTIVGDLGMNTASARKVALVRRSGEGAGVRQILVATLWVKAVTGATLAAAIFLMAPAFQSLFDKPVAPLIRLVALAILFNLLGSSFQSMMRGMHRMDLYALSNVLRDVLWVSLSVAFVLAGQGVEGAIRGYLIGQIAWFLANATIYAVLLDAPGPLWPDAVLVRELILFGIPVIAVDLMVFIYSWTDTFVLGIFRETWEVSTYNIAFGMVSMVMVVVTSVGTTVFPIFSERSVDRSPDGLTALFSRLTRLVIVAVFPLLSFIAVLGPFVVLVYGRQYSQAVFPLIVLVVWGYLRPYGGIGASLLTALARQRYVMYATAAVAGLNLALNLALIPPYGMMGAAVASTASMVLGSALILRFLAHLDGVRARPSDMTVPLLVSLVLSASMFLPLAHVLRGDPPLLPTVLILASALAVVLVTYMAALRLLGYFDEEDMDALHHATGNIPLVRHIVPALLPRSPPSTRRT